MSIKFYKTRDPHGYMSNYYKARIFVYGRWWSTTEHAYQAQKCTDPTEYDAIWQTVKANDSRLLGQKVKIREDWHTGYKDTVMKECLMAKFLQHKDLRDQLMATGDEILIEDSPVDSYWGCGADGAGVNKLGQLLMEVRQELKGE
jgi:N-glycosidase YbiA